MNTVIYHNPRCSKSRETLQLLEEKGVKPVIIDYLKTPPSVEELDRLLKALNLEPEAIVRTKEDLYSQLGLKGKKLSRAEYLQILTDNPVLMERPIVVKGSKAAIGRPPENVLKIL